MASSGPDKWKKYFADKQVETKVKAKPGQQIPVYDASGARLSFFVLDGEPLTVLPTKEFNARYPVNVMHNSKQVFCFISEAAVAKPLKRGGLATDLQRITASDFIGLGKDSYIDYASMKVKVKRFTNTTELAKSMLHGMKNNRAVNEEVYNVFEEFFRTGFKQINWNSEISDVELAKFGVYFGELLVGLYALKGGSLATQIYSPNILTGVKVTAFVVPTDPSFSGVDSLLETDSGFIGISSKFGVGAKASIFSNLLGKGIKYRSHLKSSKFKDLVQAAVNINITPDMLDKKRGSKNIVYEYGVRNILKLDKSKIRDSYEIFQNIKAGKIGKNEMEVIAAIKKYPGVDKMIADRLPKSVTSFFSRTIAKQLNADALSVQQMKEILSGKDYWQANLDIKKWQKGQVNFKFTRSGNAKLEIVGNKAAVDDLDASQGTVNYLLTSG